MKIYGLVFSPTGGSYKLLAALTDAAKDASCCDAQILDVTHNDSIKYTFSDDDLVIIAAPVYGGKMAPIAKTRMDGISGNGAKCALVAVYGNRAFESALIDMADFAQAHGFVPVAAGAFVAEHSYSTDQTPIAVGRPDKEDVADAIAFGLDLGRKYLSGQMKSVDVAAIVDIPSPEESLASFREFVKGYQMEQRMYPRQFLPEVNTATCSECGECVSVCPTGAIYNNCISLDADKCIKCCACVKVCPSGSRSLCSPFAPVLSANFSMRKRAVWEVG